jgi:drug/metabolite transporter (DMT)-like permease
MIPFEFMAVGAAACWALASLSAAPAARQLGAVAFTRWRMLFASLLLWGVALWGGGWQSLSGAGLGVLALSGVVGIFVGDTALFACMNRLGPRRSGVLFACHAIFSAVLAWVWLGETLSGITLVGSAMLVGGVMMAIVWGKRDGENHTWEETRGRLGVGVALGLVAALCQALATLMVKPMMAHGIDAVAASAVRMTAALAVHAVLWLGGWRGARSEHPATLAVLVRTAFNAALAMGLGMTLILQALHTGNAGMVAIWSSVSPVLLLPLLWLVYRRRPATGAWAGAALTVLGGALIWLH